jgi:hypothetical protein
VGNNGFVVDDEDTAVHAGEGRGSLVGREEEKGRTVRVRA